MQVLVLLHRREVVEYGLQLVLPRRGPAHHHQLLHEQEHVGADGHDLVLGRAGAV